MTIEGGEETELLTDIGGVAGPIGRSARAESTT